MENSSRLSRMLDSMNDFLAEQEWFQQIKSKWEELDDQSRLYIKIASSAAILLFLAISAISFVWSVHNLKTEINEKAELVQLLQNANDEMRRLKETNATAAAANAGGNEPWNGYFTAQAGAQGIEKGSLTVSEEKKGTGTEQAKEALFDLSLKHVSIRQVVRFAFSLENGARPVKLRNLAIDTKEDPAGYMDATLSVSAFTLNPPK